MDRSGANFFEVVRQMKDVLGATPCVISVPIGAEENFKGIVDLIKMKAILWHDETMGAEYDVEDIPAELVDECNEWRQKMIELAAEQDETLMEKFFEDPNSLTEDEIVAAIRKGTLALDIVPMTCGSSFKNKGVQTLLDYVVMFLPSPHGFRLGLHATHCTVGSYCTVEDTKRAFNLGREVNVTRSIDEIELIFYTIVSPEGSCCGRRDRDTAFLLLFHPVHGCATFVHLTDLVGFTGVEQDALGGSGLTGIDVRHDTDIARQMEVLLCHFSLML